ncbi:MAG TPA: DUF5663 domain-containing protein [Nevskiaceae bacterium]|nr:DUF5663 domain-containing protein [Nevskiaceae bacterium]
MFNFTFDEEAALRQLGLENATPETKAMVTERLHAQLDKRVGVRIQQELSNDELKAFAHASEKGDDQAKAWIAARFPNQEAMYNEELTALVGELKQHADTVVEASKNLQ